MRLRPVSWNGHDLSKSAGYDAVIPIDISLTPGADIIESALWKDYPYYGGKALRSHNLTLLFDVADDAHYNNLAEWFYSGDQSLYTLIVQDEGDLVVPNRQWQIEATAEEIPRRVENKVIVKLYVPNPLWKQAILQSESWNITASGSTKTLTVIGNQPTPPVIRFSASVAKTGGYAKKAWRPYYNVMDKAMPEYWYLLATIDTAALVSDSSKSHQINNGAGYSAVALSFNLDTAVGGGLPAGGGLAYVVSTGEQIYYSSIIAGVMTIPAGGRGWGGTTAAIIADNAVLRLSNMLANGYDLRVFIGQTEWARWLDGMNTASTKVWVTLPAHGAKAQLTLSGTIAGSGDVTTLQFKAVPDNATALGKMKAPGIVYSANGEGYAYTAIDVKKYRLTGVKRAARNTSMAVHADGAIFRYVQLDIEVVHGNALSTDPAYSDDKKPLLNLNTSTNTNWEEAEFYTANGLRGGWKPSRISSLGKISNWYTGDSAGAADPATSMGMAFFAYLSANIWKAETAAIEWLLYHPVGVTDVVSVTGQKKREKTTWAAKVLLQKSVLGTSWIDVFNETSPASAGAFVSLDTHSSISLSGIYYYLRFYKNGSIKQDANNATYFEVASITMTLASGNVPGGSLQSFVDNYYLDGTFTNTTTGDVIGIKKSMGIGDVLTIDCEAKEVYMDDGTSVVDAVYWNSKRTAWFDLIKGDNIIRFDDTGTNNVDVEFDWRARVAA